MELFFWISVSLFWSLFGSYLLTPFSYSQLQQADCDIICSGSLTSIKSLTSIFAALTIGYLSDLFGRKNCLFFCSLATLSSHLVNLIHPSSSFSSLVLVGILSSLNQNSAIAKALISDSSASERQRSVGYIGASAGVAYMTASLFAPFLASSVQQMVPISILCSLLALTILFFVFRSHSNHPPSSQPSPSSSAAPTVVSKCPQPSSPVMMTLLLLSVRFLMGLAYGLYNLSTAFFFSSRFGFTPSHHALYMFWIGFTYTLSQALLGPLLISRFRQLSSSPTLLLILSALLIALARELIFAFPASPDPASFTSFLFSFHHLSLLLSLLVANTSLGTINLLLALMVSKISRTHNTTGTLYGMMEAVEKVSAGILGPTVVGPLYLFHERAPVRAVTGLYSLIALLVWFSREPIDLMLNTETERGVGEERKREGKKER
jgi:MFS family permease